MRTSTYLWQLVTSKWNEPKETSPSFAGKNVIVTGGNAGLGLEAAKSFVRLGASKVLIAVRSMPKGEAARQIIEEATGREDVVEIWTLDMMDYGSIRGFAARAAKLGHLDIVVLNAGVAKLAYQRSSYGWEETLQVNVISTTLLAVLLLPQLAASKTPEYTPVLEIVASGTSLIINDLDSTSPMGACNLPENFSGSSLYSISKLFDLYIQAALVEKVDAKGDHSVNIVSVCPGPTRSELARDAKANAALRLMVWLFENGVQYPAAVGVRTYISGVNLGDEGHGRFWKRDQFYVPKLMEGEQGKNYQELVWNEIVSALEKDVPDIHDLVASI